MLLTSSLTSDLLVFVATFLTILISYFHWSYKYWHRRNALYLKPKIPYGNVSEGVKGKDSFANVFKQIYEEMKKNGWKHGGIYILKDPCYFILNLDTIKNVMVKDFSYFIDRRRYYYNKNDPLQEHIINLNGSEWKSLRSKTTSMFTFGKMKMLFPGMVDIVATMQKEIDKEISINKFICIDKVVMSFASKIISLAFGADPKESGDKMTYLVDILGRRLLSSSVGYNIKRNLALIFPRIAKFLNISLLDRETANVIRTAINSIITFRENENYVGNDLMQSLINLKNKNSITMNQLESQCALLIGAGFETSSNTLIFAIYELARNQLVQEKLRQEINEILAQNDDRITYESVKSMEYLNQVIDECLRMYPSLSQFGRTCVKDYKIPGENLVIKEGTQILVSALGIHYDEDYYPNPTQFDPKRFDKEEKAKRHEFTFMPFGKGSRSCIAKYLALLILKLGLITFVKNYKFRFNSETIEPIVFKPNCLTLKMQEELWLKVEKV